MRQVNPSVSTLIAMSSSNRPNGPALSLSNGLTIRFQFASVLFALAGRRTRGHE